jgi:hypothetical protein
MELHSLVNYQNVTQNSFCATHFLRHLLVEFFPQTSDLAVQLEALDVTTILIPPSRSSPPPSAPHMPIVRAEGQLPVDKTMHPAWTESEIRSVVGLFELLDRWNSSFNDQTSNLTSWIFRFSVNLKCEWTCPISALEYQMIEAAICSRVSSREQQQKESRSKGKRSSCASMPSAMASRSSKRSRALKASPNAKDHSKNSSV